MPCPAERNFERVNDGGQYKCVYKSDKQIFVNLSTIGAVDMNGSTVDELQTTNPSAANQFMAEKTRVTSELTSQYRAVDSKQRVQDAFVALQAAQNAQDESPEAYQAARINYYTLLYGDEWKDGEKARIAKTEVDPIIRDYKSRHSELTTRLNSQKTTIDVVNNLKDNVLTLKDDFQYSVNTFTDQLSKLQSQINIDRRDRAQPKEDPWKWMDTAMNILIVLGLFAAIGIGYSRWSQHRRLTSFRPPVAYTVGHPTY